MKIIKPLCLLAGITMAGTVWAGCPVIVDRLNINYDSVLLKPLTSLDEKGGTIYFCQTDNSKSEQHWEIDDSRLVHLANGAQLHNGTASVVLGGTDGVSATHELGVGSVVIDDGRSMPDDLLRTSTDTYPTSNVVLGNSFITVGVFNFYQQARLTPDRLRIRNDIKNKMCSGEHASEATYTNIIKYLKDNAKNLFEFDNNIVGNYEWQPSSGNIIATAKIKIKADGAGSGVLPATVALHWLNNRRAQFFGTDGNPNVNQKYLFCWVNVGVSIKLDIDDHNFRHSGKFSTKLTVNYP